MKNQLTPRHLSQVRKSHIQPYSPFPYNGQLYLRDRNGECFKASLKNNSFIWVEIDPSEYPIANQSQLAA